ncbi:MAG TPA: adenylate/guanylate cyclase domain-containing protein [Spirochaetota bacterium]|nr:adenylate/guanylate cyclase domain-containing protein [Spirochaetota bacterium]
MIKRYLEIANKFIEENKFSGIAVALVFYLLVVLFCFTVVYERFELNLYDLRFKLRPSIKEWERLAFLDIDENSLTIVGQYPWPRNLYADGLNTMKDLGVSQVSFDMMFLDATPKTLDDKDYETLMKKIGKGNRLSLADLESAGWNKDKVFADSIAAYDHAILSYTFTDEPANYDVLERQKKDSFKKAQKRFLERSSVKLTPHETERLKSLDDPETKSISYPIPEFMNTGRGFGFVNRYTDIDGTVRKVQLVKVFQGRLYFNLAMIMLMDVCRVPLNSVKVTPGRNIVLKKAINPVTLETEDLSIPIDSKGMMYVTWAGSGQNKGGRFENTFLHIPFYAVLEYPKYADMVKKIYEEEDQIKAEKINGLTEQLEGFTEQYKEGDDATKKNMAPSIAELKKQLEALKKNSLLGELNERLAKARAELAAPGSSAVKMKIWKEITDIKHEMNRAKLEYLGNYDEEIKKLKSEIKKGAGSNRKEELKQMEFLQKAMNLGLLVENLSDTIALSGLVAAGTQDIGSIPLHNVYARVGTYHNTINTIIQKQFIKRVNWPVNLAIMLALAVAMGFIIQRLDAKKSLVTMLGTFIVLNLVVMLFFVLANLWFQQLGIILSMFLPALAIVAIKFMKEESQKRFIKGAFSYYLSPTVIDEIIKDPDSLELGGEDREITIYFSDIKAFSTISEKLTPKELVVRLNEYLTEMTDIILKYNGTVDKYIGDSIMAFYGAPTVMPDHAAKACLAAIDMKKRLRELQEKWRNAGLEPIYARMGIHSGKATVGNMGSRTRMDYTAMGDAVNLASRLEGANKFYETSVMISGTTYDGVKDIVDARQLDVIRVVGKSQAVPIYELLGKKGTLPDRIYEMLEKYNQGREFFLNRDWKQAKLLFKQALKVVDDDGPSRVYVERCDTYAKNPPSRGWDGVYVLKGK